MLATLVIASMIGQARAPSAAERLEQAEVARFANRPAQCLKHLGPLLHADPESTVEIGAHLVYQKLLASQGKREQLMREYEGRYKSRPTAGHHLLLAELQADAKVAERLCRKGLELDPASYLLRRGLARALSRQHRTDAAVAAYEHAAAVGSGDLLPRLAIVNLLDSAGRGAELLERYEVDPSTRDWRAALLFGAALAANRQFERADELLERARELAPESPEVPSARGTVAVLRLQLDDAVRYFERARKLAPRDTDVLHKLGLTMGLRGDERGVLLLRRAVRLEPFEAGVLSDLGALLLVRKDVAAAEACQRRALLLDTSCAQALQRLSHVLALRGETDDALRFIQRAIAIDPSSADYQTQLADVHRRRGRHDLARAALEKAKHLTIRSDYAVDPVGGAVRGQRDLRRDGRLHLARELVFQGELEAAREEYTAALELDPECRTAFEGLAILDERAGDLAAARVNWRQCHKLARPGSTLAAYYEIRTADCAYGSGETELALAAYRAIARRYGDALPRGEAIAEIIASIGRVDTDPRRVEIEGVRIGRCDKERYCVPHALYAILRHWKLPADVRDLGRRLVRAAGARMQDVTELLGQIAGVRAISFLADAPLLEKLVERGWPVMLVRALPWDGDWSGHASVVTGYDDRLGVFLLEDSNWYLGVRRVHYSRVAGQRALLVLPEEQLDDFALGLPGQRYCELVARIEAKARSDPQGLVALADEAIQLRPKHSLAHVYRALALLRKGDSRAIVASARQLLVARPEDGRAHEILGHAYLAERKTALAIGAFSNAAALSPRAAGPRSALARIYGRSRRYVAAIEQARALVSVQRRGPHLELLGNLLAAEGELTEAKRVLEEALLTGTAVSCYRTLAIVELRSGNRERALELLERYCRREKNPERLAQARRMLARWKKER